jgi:hypothetical protein
VDIPPNLNDPLVEWEVLPCGGGLALASGKPSILANHPQLELHLGLRGDETAGTASLFIYDSRPRCGF